MIAVLQDKKGFTKTEWIPYPRPTIEILTADFEPTTMWEIAKNPTPITTKTLTFYKDHELGHPEVWLYVER